MIDHRSYVLNLSSCEIKACAFILRSFVSWFPPLVLVLIERTAIGNISKHLDFCQKYSAARRVFNSRLEMWSNTVFRV